MEQIYYKVDDYDNLCLTKCPHGEQDDKGRVRYVASHSCSICPYFVKDDYSNNVLTCNYDVDDYAEQR